MIAQINPLELQFPHPNSADEDGIVAFGGDLSPERLLLAYRSGIFPWYSRHDPILWWSPDPRLIMNLEDFKFRKSLKKRMKYFEVEFDTNFSEVIRRCGSKFRPGQEGSWIIPDVIEAYERLHHLGHAHSVEVYQNGHLVGGLYGVVVGAVFCGESMFTDVNDASKVGFATLVAHLKYWGYDFVDAQVPTQHLKSLGAIEVDRDTFLQRLDHGVKMEIKSHKWKFCANLLKDNEI